jgi:serine/threonine protein kinase
MVAFLAHRKVFRALDSEDQSVCALKRVGIHPRRGIPVSTIREIRILSHLRHENVIRLKEVVLESEKVNPKGRNQYMYLVFHYVEHDMFGLLHSPTIPRFSLRRTKCYLYQILKGLKFMHDNGVYHRDLKGSNVLVGNDGIVQLGDFGLARSLEFDMDRKLSHEVVTLWYRAPELLLGAPGYGYEIDIWSVGCLFAEMLTNKIIFQGRSEARQLRVIFELHGTPGVEALDYLSHLPYGREFWPHVKWNDRLPEFLRA